MHLFLIGPRGSGKSTVAPLVAARLDRPYWCVDDEIQLESGRTIAQIFAESGESGFRELESEVLSRIDGRPPGVVDLGGGAVLREANRRRMKAAGKIVWLKATPERLWQRIAADPASARTRPPLLPLDPTDIRTENPLGDSTDREEDEPPGLREMRRVVAERASLYADCADYEIDTGGLAPDETARRIAAWFRSVDKKSSGTA